MKEHNDLRHSSELQHKLTEDDRGCLSCFVEEDTKSLCRGSPVYHRSDQQDGDHHSE